jgi:hypothetical protein
MDSLFQAGALDVFLSPIIMKKSRPANKISVLATERDKQGLTDILLRETTSFGVRYSKVHRTVLEREMKTVTTSWGPIRVKIGKLNGEVIQASPEYEDCKKLSKKKKVPVNIVFNEARSLAIKLIS